MNQQETKQQIINRLFPKALPSIAEIEARYTSRELKSGQMVTRIAPSPTGFMHVGTIYTALVNERLAHQSGGVFFLRIEDTDKKREVAGATDLIVKSLAHYGIRVDEGQNAAGEEIGAYGPYKQSAREEIYQAYVKSLVERGLAYPCFVTSEELDAIRSEQEALKIRPGYYGKWAKWRNKTDEEVIAALDAGLPFVIRFKSPGNFDNYVAMTDLLLGDRKVSENDQDIVLMKSDGMPLYHLAHVVDDHLMQTTHVIRGDEWFSSVSLHLQLFTAMGWTAPRYGHIPPIQKMDGKSKRKISKRKDPEANALFYDEQGYPKDAVLEYLINLANSNFEDWRKANPTADNREFQITLEKLAGSNGPLFDFVKLGDISKEIIARYSADRVCDEYLAWAEKYQTDFGTFVQVNRDYVIRIFNIERGTDGMARKDFAKWSDVRGEIEYFFDEHFQMSAEKAIETIGNLRIEDVKNIVEAYMKIHDDKFTKEEWFAKLKEIAKANGFADNMKEFKADPSAFKGNVADVAKIFRVLLTGRVQSPDLHAVIAVMGRERVFARLSAVI